MSLLSSDSPIYAGNVVRHYKGGRYKVIAFGRDAETAQPVVIYMSLGTGQYWVRREVEFGDEVKWPDGVLRKRFVVDTPIKPLAPDTNDAGDPTPFRQRIRAITNRGIDNLLAVVDARASARCPHCGLSSTSTAAAPVSAPYIAGQPCPSCKYVEVKAP